MFFAYLINLYLAFNTMICIKDFNDKVKRGFPLPPFCIWDWQVYQKREVTITIFKYNIFLTGVYAAQLCVLRNLCFPVYYVEKYIFTNAPVNNLHIFWLLSRFCKVIETMRFMLLIIHVSLAIRYVYNLQGRVIIHPILKHSALIEKFPNPSEMWVKPIAFTISPIA